MSDALVARSRPASRPTPRPYESPFSADEIFFSTTDAKGIIRSGNRVFTRVSGYSREEIFGSAHNIVRHPDMPRAIFQLFWEELNADRPIAAYVKNMAKDGNYYWVMATSVPCQGGFLSVRIKPSTPYFDAAQKVYADLLAMEQSIEANGARHRPEAMAASRARLKELLREAGFCTYDAFMRAALLAEVKQRQATMGQHRAKRSYERAPVATDSLHGILAACGPLQEFLDLLVRRLDEYEELNAKLAEKSHVVLEIAENVRLFSLNALLAATRLGTDGASLSAVASLMQSRSNQSDPLFEALNEDVTACADLLSAMSFPVAAASLQVETLTVFVRELLQGGNGEQPSASDLGALANCLVDAIERLDAVVGELDQRVRMLGQHVSHLSSDISVMRTLELNGRIEAAHASESSAVVALFRTIAEQIGTARNEIDDLARLSHFSVAGEAALAQKSRRYVAAVRRQVALAAGGR